MGVDVNNFAVLGRPVSHSLSPVIFSEYISGRPGYNYSRILAEDISEINGLREAFDIRGLNITAPFKSDILDLVDGLSDEVKKLGVANTVIFDKNHSAAFNTDIFGVLNPLMKRDLSVDSNVLVLGAGGAAKSVVFALIKGGFNKITISNRSKNKAVELSKSFDVKVIEPEKTGGEEFDLIVNTIPVKADFLKSIKLREGATVFDANYNNAPMKDMAANSGVDYISGVEWLIEQGKKSYRLMTGIPDGEVDVSSIDKSKITQKSRKISLIGPMGSWKSSVGRHLSKMLGYRFLDIDFLIEQREGMSITEIFSQKGEEYFRKIENLVLKEASKIDNVILSTGGGIIRQQANIDVLKDNCWNILLYASPKECKNRIDVDKRPLLKGKDVMRVLEELFGQRKNKYFETSDLIINTEGKTSLKIAELLYEDYSRTFGV